MTPKKKKIKRKQWIGLVFIAPWLIGLIGLQVYPFVASLFYSFTEYNIMSSPKWIGLANYVKLFTADNEFWYSVKVTLIYTIFTVPGKLTVALIVALVMNKKHERNQFHSYNLLYPVSDRRQHRYCHSLEADVPGGGYYQFPVESNPSADPALAGRSQDSITDDHSTATVDVWIFLRYVPGSPEKCTGGSV